MLYPTVDELIKIKVNGEVIGNRYRLVNVAARMARDIADDAMAEGRRLEDKPVKLAVRSLYESGENPGGFYASSHQGTGESGEK